KIPRDVGINKISSNAKDKPFTIKTPATEKQIINNTILLGFWVVACSFERFLGKAPSLLNEYLNCVRLATNAFEVPVQMIKAKIAVTYLAQAPTASPIIILIGDRLRSALQILTVPIVTKHNTKNSTTIITALIIVNFTISVSGILKLLAKLQMASQQNKDHNIIVTSLSIEIHPFGRNVVKFH